MTDIKGLRQVGYLDCAGSGQVVVEGGYAYLGHMDAPLGTSIIDVGDPSKPVVVSELSMPPGTHSHKVRVSGDVMVINQELNPKKGAAPDDFLGGFKVYDVSDRARPREIFHWKEKGRGVHRFDFDGRYAYLSPTFDGYLSNIVSIFDFANPEQPREVGRWWKPGQWTAGGEVPTWEGTAHRCHHPLRMGDRLYVSYWLGGLFILDISDITAPKQIAHMSWQPTLGCPTHTALPIPFEINGRSMMMMAEEDVSRREDQPAAGLWMIDIDDETQPITVGSFQLPGLEGLGIPTYTACHQPSEKVTGTEIPVSYFEHGLRVIDFSNPRSMKEVAHFVPEPHDGNRVQSNDVTTDDRGLIYLVDRHRGMHILEKI